MAMGWGSGRAYSKIRQKEKSALGSGTWAPHPAACPLPHLTSCKAKGQDSMSDSSLHSLELEGLEEMSWSHVGGQRAGL